MATFIQKDKQQVGPLDDSEVLMAIQNRIYSPEDLAWREGMADWQPLRNLYPSAQLPPPLPPQQGPPPAQHLGDDAGIRLLLPVGRSGWAIAAGYLGLFSLIVLPAPISLLVSIIAIRDIRKSKGSAHPKHGMGRAIFGLIMGILGTTLILLALLFSAKG